MPIFQVDLEQRGELQVTAQSDQDPDPDLSTTTSTTTPSTTSTALPLSLSRPHSHFPSRHTPSSLLRKLSEESIRTELCEGPIPDSPRPASPEADPEAITSNRAELIERLKRGESPTWIPNRHLESIFNGPSPPSQPPPRSPSSPQPSLNHPNHLLPPVDITPENDNVPQSSTDEETRLREGLDIQRPRSALHSGDFTHDRSQSRRDPSQRPLPLRDLPQVDSANHERPKLGHLHASDSSPWIATSPPRHFNPFAFERRPSHVDRSDDFRSQPSSLSSSLSSSFAYKPPTSPLVQSESNEDIELAGPVDNVHLDSTPLSFRRHTLTSPSPFSLPPRSTSSTSFPRPPSHRREASLPYQAHQPRRSLASIPNIHALGTSPQTPAFLRPRRPSLSSETSPLQHASMVGSYEESILRGRMSTTPSKPLDFLAQIGVLGLGKCKPSLKCPSHVTLPFPAVFYSYGNSSSQARTLLEDGPSPYVGQIDLENGLPNHGGENRSRRKMHTRFTERRIAEDETVSGDRPADGSDRETRRAARNRRRSRSPRAPPGGSYRIPEKGQIQIVIKNPNKTAVKLFLVPYDLAGMEPGTKTFIRQRSYSAGPIIDNAPVPEEPMADRPILRYLVHLHICCPSKGRFYLYKSIRIVFANRVPDGKEKLRNETTWPEPRFTTYKPIRVMHPPLSTTSGPGAMLAAEKAFRRRSSGFAIGQSAQVFDLMDGVSQSLQATTTTTTTTHPSSPSPFIYGSSHNHQTIDPIPLRLPARNRLGSDLSDSTATTGLGLRSPASSSQASRPVTKDGVDGQIARYQKLNKGDVGYGGNYFAASGSGSPGTEGLLSQRLRSLGVQPQYTSPPERDQDD